MMVVVYHHRNVHLVDVRVEEEGSGIAEEASDHWTRVEVRHDSIHHCIANVLRSIVEMEEVEDVWTEDETIHDCCAEVTIEESAVVHSLPFEARYCIQCSPWVIA